MRLETERLILRPVRRSDAAAMVPLINNFEISKWLSSVPFPYTEENAQTFLSIFSDNDRPAHACPFAIERKETPGQLIGTFGVEPHLDADGNLPDIAEVGYWLGQPFWGRGFVSEAAAAMVAMGFEQGRYAKLEACHFDGNHGSARILEKCGFVDIGPKVMFCRARGKDAPGRALELSRERWKALRL